MNEYNQKLKQFVEESYNRIKKQKKSPKNFWVLENSPKNFELVKFPVGNDSSKFNLNNLYTSKGYNIIESLETLNQKSPVQEQERGITINKALEQPKTTKASKEQLKKEIFGEAIKDTNTIDVYEKFQLKWIPILKDMLNTDYELYTYEELAEEEKKKVVNKEDHNNFVNWSKQ